MTDLFTYVGSRRRDPTTSHDAANANQSGRHKDRQRALEIHRAHPDGLTDHELAALMDRVQPSAGKRRGELRDAGLIVDSGERRRTPQGSTAIVWKLKQGSE